MGLEIATYIGQLDENWPLGTDPVSRGDDHLRLIKSVLQNQFPNLGNEAVTKTAAELNASSTPTGAVIQTAGTTAPNGWLFCKGQEVSRGTYSDLFAAVGTAYGAGNGSSTFNVPNMVNKVAAGVSGTNIIGSTGGKDSWTEADVPNHTHTMDEGGIHSHKMRSSSFQNTSGNDRVADKDNDNEELVSTNTDGAHAHTIKTNNGAGATADNRQATLYFNFIIKT